MTVRNIRPFGIARIATSADGLFQPDPKGEPAVLIGVDDSLGRLGDLCAWIPDAPGRWWLRTGDCPILGAEAIANAAEDGRSIRLWSTPQQWLMAKPRDCIRPTAACYRVCGTCSVPRRGAILDWSADLRQTFQGVASVHCDHPELETRFRRALRRCEPRELGHAAGGST